MNVDLLGQVILCGQDSSPSVAQKTEAVGVLQQFEIYEQPEV
jgi:hypothetical protein